MIQKGVGLIGLVRQGWNEIPEIMGSGCLALILMFPAGWSLHKYYKEGKNNKRYKQEFVIMRPDDPRVPLVHKD